MARIVDYGGRSPQRPKKATEEEWRALAAQTRLCERELIKLANMGYEIMPVRISDPLLAVRNRTLHKFEHHAENVMYERDGLRLHDVFFMDEPKGDEGDDAAARKIRACSGE